MRIGFYTFLIMLMTLSPVSATAGETYKLSMLPRYSSDEINRRIRSLSQYIAENTGAVIDPVVTSDFTQYEKQIKNGTISIGYQNPSIYTMVSETHEVLAMALKSEDRDKFRGIIITRKDTGLHTLRDLRGKTISIVGHTSAGGYLSQKLSLMKAGIDVEKACTIVEAVENKQENVILAVYAKDADAGFIRESALTIVDKYIAANQIKVFRECEWLPNWAFSVKRNMPKNLKLQIQNALLRLKPGHPVLDALKIDGFRTAKDTDYDVVRAALKK